MATKVITVAKPFDEHRRALFHRSGGANVAVAVDTRFKARPKKRGKGVAYDRRRANRGGE